MRYTLLFATAGFFFTQAAQATLLFYDSFNYTPSPNPALHDLPDQLGQNWPTTSGNPVPPWIDYYSGNSNPYVASGNLSYTGLVTDTSSSSNNATYKGSNGSGDAYHFFGQPTTWDGTSQPPFPTSDYPVNPTTSTTLYYSLLLNVNQIGTVDGWDTGSSFPNGQFLTAFMNTTSYTGQTAQTATAGALVIESGDGSQFSTTYKLGIGNTDKTNGDSFSGTAYGLNQTLFIVVAYTMTSGTDTATLYIDPTPGSLESANTVAAQITGEPAGSLTGFVLKDDQHMPDDGLEIDELRIGTTWAEVTPAVPEPTTLWFLGIGTLALIGNRRRTRPDRV